jgi:ATP dependent DNA ligase domain
MAQLPVEDALFDGEIVALDNNGLPSFQALQHRSARTIVYYTFDIIHLNGRDLMKTSLEQRRSVLAGLSRVLKYYVRSHCRARPTTLKKLFGGCNSKASSQSDGRHCTNLAKPFVDQSEIQSAARIRDRWFQAKRLELRILTGWLSRRGTVVLRQQGTCGLNRLRSIGCIPKNCRRSNSTLSICKPSKQRLGTLGRRHKRRRHGEPSLGGTEAGRRGVVCRMDERRFAAPFGIRCGA